MTNALYGPPQAPQDNALYYDDTQGMPRQRPADPLRWLADAVGQNKDLPAPQFFMDPRALSARNMLHSALNTSANWLDGTRDPSRIGPEEMIAPLGLAGMGTGLANALSRPGRDFRIGDDLARQHPGASAVGDIPRFAPIRDAGNPTSAAYVADFGSMPTAPRAPVNSNATPYAVMADNANGSAPGTVVNSLADPEIIAHLEKRQRGNQYADAKLKRAEEKKAAWAARRGASPAPEMPTAPDSIGGSLMAVRKGIAVNDGTAGWRVTDRPSVENARDGIRPAATAGKVEPDYPFSLTMRRSNDLLADNAKGSAPGTVLNSLDMSEAARMQRAREMGFGEQTWYHGTDQQIDAFDPKHLGANTGADSAKGAVFMTSDPHTAGEYAMMSGGRDFTAAKQRAAAAEKAGDWEAHYKANDDMERIGLAIDTYGPGQGYNVGTNIMPLRARGNFDEVDFAGKPWEEGAYLNAMALARLGNKDGVIYRGAADSPFSKDRLSDVMAVFNPSHIRSTQAAFDPAKRDSANLLAASPSASAPGLAANSTQPERPVRQDDQGVMSILRRYGLAD